MRAFVDAPDAACSACGAALVVIRNRRDGDGDAALTVRCSQFRVRDSDGNRMCRQEVDTSTITDWHDDAFSSEQS